MRIRWTEEPGVFVHLRRENLRLRTTKSVPHSADQEEITLVHFMVKTWGEWRRESRFSLVTAWELTEFGWTAVSQGLRTLLHPETPTRLPQQPAVRQVETR